MLRLRFFGQFDEVPLAGTVSAMGYPVAALGYRAITAAVRVLFTAMRAGQFEKPAFTPASGRCNDNRISHGAALPAWKAKPTAQATRTKPLPRKRKQYGEEC
jgi:hypothetical protein